MERELEAMAERVEAEYAAEQEQQAEGGGSVPSRESLMTQRNGKGWVR
jgi:hypothetical protein